MAQISSPSKTLGSTNAEQLSTTDDTPYAVIYVESRQGNGESHVGGPEVTATTGGHRMTAGGNFFFGPSPNMSYRLTQIYIAGVNGDTFDTICTKSSGAMNQQ